MFLPIFLTLCILLSHSSANVVYDFCVADLSLPYGPAGYACKDPKRVTIDDFVFENLTVPTNTANMFKWDAKLIDTAKLPGLNGLGVSVGPSTIDVGGMFPIHTHRVSEVFLVVEGTIVAGFIDSNNKAYYKTLNQGDLIIFPQTLLHFVINVGSTRAISDSTFASENLRTQVFAGALFGGNLPTDLIEKVDLANHEQVQKLKKLCGGTN